MPSNLWLRLASLGFAGALICCAGCGDENGNGAGPPEEQPDPNPTTAMNALDAVVDAIEAAHYLKEDGSPVVTSKGDTTSVDNLTLVRVAGDFVSVDPAFEYFGMAASPWTYVFVDEQRTISAGGFTGPSKYVVSRDIYGDISSEVLPWRVDEADEVNNGVIQELAGWDVDSDAAVDTLVNDANSNLNLTMARLDSLLGLVQYVVSDTIYLPAIEGAEPIDLVTEVEVGGESYLRVARFDPTSADYDTTDYLLDDSAAVEKETYVYVPMAEEDPAISIMPYDPYTVIFWTANNDNWTATNATATAIWQAGEAMYEDGFREIATSLCGANDDCPEGYVKLWRALTDNSLVYVTGVDPSWVLGEIVVADHPDSTTLATDLATAANVVLTVTAPPGDIEGEDRVAQAYDSADVWTLPHGGTDFYFTSEADSVRSEALGYWRIDHIDVSAETFYVDPSDLGVTIEELNPYVNLVLGNFGDPEVFGWGATSRFYDPEFNEPIPNFSVFDVVPAGSNPDSI